MQNIGKLLGKTRVDEGLALASQMQPLDRQWLVSGIIEGCDADALAGIARWLGHAELPNRVACYQRVYKRWSTTAPEMASQWLSQVPAGNEQNAAMNQLAIHWGRRDAEQALLWAESLPTLVDSGPVQSIGMGGIQTPVTRYCRQHAEELIRNCWVYGDNPKQSRPD